MAVINPIISGFYSKLVRLKGATVDVELTGHIRFYSKLVRLKVKLFGEGKKDANQFLFQTGSIKSESLCISFALAARFYSKLVRLKARCLGHRGALLCCFYSKLVRLKGITAYSNETGNKVSIPNWFD